MQHILFETEHQPGRHSTAHRPLESARQQAQMEGPHPEKGRFFHDYGDPDDTVGQDVYRSPGNSRVVLDDREERARGLFPSGPGQHQKASDRQVKVNGKPMFAHAADHYLRERHGIDAVGLLALIVIGCLLCVTQTACTAAGTLEAIVTAASLAANTIATLDPNLPGVTLAASYINAVGLGVQCAIAERQSSDPPATQIAKITACVSAAVQPVLPPGTPTQVVNLLTGVANAIASYLSSLTSPSAAANLAKLDGGSLNTMGVQAGTFRGKLDQMVNHPR